MSRVRAGDHLVRRFAPSFLVGRRSMGWADHRSLARQLDEEFDRLVGRATSLSVDHRPTRRRRRSVSKALFQHVAPVAEASRQHCTLSLPFRWDAAVRREVGDARFVTIASGDPIARHTSSLMPILISGRPVVLADDDGENGRPVPGPSFSEACHLSESDLALTALNQLRSLLGYGDDVDGAPSVEHVRPEISVVLSTNRVGNLAGAVARIQAQQFVDVRLFVGLHGLDIEVASDIEFVGGAVTSVELVPFEASVLFGDVLGDLSGRAPTRYLSKWDDDDLYGRHHLIDLWIFAVLARSALVGKAAEFVLLEESGLLIRRRGGEPYRSSRFLAGGALLMSSAALRGVGGWGHLARGVDQDIIARFGRNGLRSFRIHGYEFVLVRHGEGHTWEADDTYFLSAADRAWSSSAVGRLTGIGDTTSYHRSLPIDGCPTKGETGSPSISVCVPNMNNQSAVEMLERQCADFVPRPELVICDDRSDPPLALVGIAPAARLVDAPPGDGFGVGRSRQRAFEASSGDVLIFTDADVHVSDQAYVDIVRTFQEGFIGAIHAEIGFASLDSSAALRVVTDRGVGQLAADLASRRIDGQVWREPHWAASADLALPRSSSYRATVGAFLAIDRASYLRTGGFRDIVVRGVEDTDFGYRLLASGCAQQVYRRDGIWHLGERTFAAALTGGEELRRELHRSALIPIWSRSAAERRDTLEQWTGEIVPFVSFGSTSAADMSDTVNQALGRGLVTSDERWPSLLSAPFALLVSASAPRLLTRAVEVAFDSFRNRSCGEVVVVDSGAEVARFVALWAVNRVRTSQGLPVDGLSVDQLASPAVIDEVRTQIGLTVVQC